MTKTKIWFSSPHMRFNEQLYVKETFDSKWVAPLGSNVDLFEKALEQYISDVLHVAALRTGTAAIHIALELLGVGKGDGEVRYPKQ